MTPFEKNSNYYFRPQNPRIFSPMESSTPLQQSPVVGSGGAAVARDDDGFRFKRPAPSNTTREEEDCSQHLDGLDEESLFGDF